MNRLYVIPALAAALLALGSAFILLEHDVPAHQDPDWEAFHMDSLRTDRASSGRNYLPFLNVSTLSTGLYELSAGASDPQPVHDRDEVYHILSGEADLVADDKRIPVRPGSVVYVRAGVDHRFSDIRSDLSVLVFFSNKTPEQTE